MSNVLSIKGFKLTRIAKLNDAFRTSFFGGRVVLTNGVNCLPEDQLLEVVYAGVKARLFAAGQTKSNLRTIPASE